MASLDLSQDDLKAIESTRNRLFQLSNSISSLKNDLYKSSPLPSAASLQASAFILQQNLASLQRVLTDNAELFRRVAVHPSTNFPGRTQEPVLLQLLRKKLEPDIETWADQGREVALAAGVDVSGGGSRRRGGGGAGGGGSGTGGRGGSEDDEDEDEDDEEGYRPEDDDAEDGFGDPLGYLWADIRDACLERVGEYVRNEDQDVYTAEERAVGVENVRTGLKRNLEDDDDDDDESEEEAGEGDQRVGGIGAATSNADTAVSVVDMTGGSDPDGTPLSEPEIDPELLLWFTARGDLDLPATIETESQRRAKEAGKRPG